MYLRPQLIILVLGIALLGTCLTSGYDRIWLNDTKIDGKPVKFIFDSGADTICLLPDSVRQLGALSDFYEACELNPTNDYTHFGIWLSSSLLGNSKGATEELKKYLATLQANKTNDWPSQIGCFLVDQMTEKELISAAENANARRNQEQHCEAYFYIGSKRLVVGDKAVAASYFEKCLATGVQNFNEYQSAKAELRVLKDAN